MSTVLLATDGSDLATSALVRGLEVIGRDHTFHALAVVPFAISPAVSPLDGQPLLVDPMLEGELEQQEKAESTADLAALNDVLGIDAAPLVEVGEPGPTICRVAGHLNADVVVLGSHGHGWFQRVLLGSVSRYVIDHAPCPVFVVRLEPAED
jgi:nucleotide-binding universal stress UspA family protein